MKTTVLAALIVSGAAISDAAFAKEIGEAPSSSDNTFNLSLSVPSGVIAEMKVATSIAAGIYAERSAGGGAPGGGGPKHSSNSGAEDEDHTNVTSSSVGVQAHWKPSGAVFANGVYLSPYLGYVSAKLSSSATGYSSKASGMALGVIGGYGWFWGSGFNLGVGLGARYSTLTVDNAKYTGKDSSDKELVSGRLRGGGPTAEFTIGFAF